MEDKEQNFEGNEFGFSDITIRTMSSDIKKIAEEGGSAIRTYKWGEPLHALKIENKSEEKTNSQNNLNPFLSKPEIPTNEQKENLNQNTQTKTNKNFKLILGIFAFIVFFALGYFVLPKIIPQKVAQKVEPDIKQSPNENIISQNQNENQTTKQTNESTKETITYISPFKIKPGFFEIKTNLSIPDFQKYYQFLITTTLGNTTTSNTSTQNFFEILLTDENSKPINNYAFLESLNIKSLPNSFWTNNFNQNFFIFVYKNKNGLWPGYIFELKNNVVLPILQTDLKKIESNTEELKNFFLKPVDFSSKTFKSEQILGREPIRIITSNNNEVFVYGIFFNKYLIISTSKEGLEEAIKRM
jgi:hypothetical protein